jgi:hypothetical protein
MVQELIVLVGLLACDNIPETRLKEKIILAHGFRGFSPWLAGSIAFRPMGREKYQNVGGGGRGKKKLEEEREERRKRDRKRLGTRLVPKISASDKMKVACVKKDIPVYTDPRESMGLAAKCHSSTSLRCQGVPEELW